MLLGCGVVVVTVDSDVVGPLPSCPHEAIIKTKLTAQARRGRRGGMTPGYGDDGGIRFGP